MYVRLVRVMIESGGLLCGSSRAHELLLYYIACCRQTEEDSQLPNLLHCIALHRLHSQLEGIRILSARSCRRNDGPANGNEEAKSSAGFVCYLFGSDMYMLDKYLH